MSRSDVRIALKENCTRPVQLLNALPLIISTDPGITVHESEGHSRNSLMTESICLKQNEDCEGGDNSEAGG
jgi:hypothetical protein